MSLVKCYNAVTCSYPNDYRPEHLNLAPAILATSGQTGTLLNPTIGNYLDLVLPYGIVIGDSIAEGQPVGYGRLNASGSGGFTPGQGSTNGQMCRELAKQYGMPVINHGIGGQTTVQVRARWGRDVLGQTVNVGDGRGNFTLGVAHGVLPRFVHLHCGVNDICQGVAVATIKDNLTFFAQSCRDNGIKLILDTIGPEPTYFQDSTKASAAAEINAYIKGDLKTAFPEIAVVDFLLWATDGTNSYTTVRSGMFADGLHPNATGYAAFADYVAAVVTAPVYLKKLVLNSAVNGPSGFGRATSISANGVVMTLPNAATQEVLAPCNNYDNPEWRLTGNGLSLVTGASIGFWGYAGITAEFQSARLLAQQNPLPQGASTVTVLQSGTYSFTNGTLTFGNPNTLVIS